MAWVFDTYDMMHSGRNNLPVVTGKPVDIGGSYGRREATARGCLYVTQRALQAGVVPGLTSVADASVAIQGFGNAGSIAAQLYAQAGARIVAVSDSRGGIFSESGLDPDAVIAHKATTGSVRGYPGTQAVTNDELLELDVDILIPAAMECQIRGDNASRVKAKLVVEAANGPTTPAADRILFSKGIAVLPDILANAGGVTVSYFEWVQNIENEQWDEVAVNTKLLRKMERATDRIIETQAEVNQTLDDIAAQSRQVGGSNGSPLDPIDLRTAAYIDGVRRVANVAMARDEEGSTCGEEARRSARR
jgi:glutamate dehydrogenase (NAD(P)+)